MMSSAWTAVVLGALLIMAGTLQGTSVAYAAPYEVSGEESCLTLPGTTRWDPALERCTLLDSMTVLSGRVLTVGQGVTLFVDAKAKVASWGTITNQANATLVIAGKMTVNSGATLVNSGVFSNFGTLANSGVFVNSADAVFKNTGRITNAGTLTNSAGAALANSGKITNDAIINNQGHVENRGTLTVSKEAMLTSSQGAAVKNSGRVMVYCSAHIAGAISGRPPTDKCDDPPAAAMGLWSPFNPISNDGQVGTVFTFRANATDDIKLAKLEWDFDGDGKADYTRPLSGRSVMATASHAFGEQGVYYPQVRAVDSSGARSAWDRYAPIGLDIASANEAPLAVSFATSTEQDAPLAFILEAKDLDGDSLTFSLVSLPEHGILLGDAPDLSYVPDEGFLGHDSFTFAAGDGKGGESKPARVSITVVGRAEAEAGTEDKQTEATARRASQPPQGAQEEMPYNNQPMAQGQSVSTTEEVSTSVRLAATDADGDWLEFQIVSDPRYGMLSGTAPDLTYMPDAEFYGQDSFAFMASDSFGGSSTATVTVTVNPVNDMPAAYDDSASTAQETQVPIYVLENDEDVEAEYLSITSASDPQNGSASLGDGLVTYSPDSGFSGIDSFTYTISDGQGGTASATVTVTVAASTPVPVPEPAPQPDPAQIYCGRQVSSFAHVIDGTDGKDTLNGTKEDDLVRGYGGNDVLKGNAGNDCIIGGQGDDKMYGGAGQDALEGGEGDDNMWGGTDNDRMWGGAGSDKVIGDGGVDLLYGDAGDDRMWGGADNDTLFAGSGNDKLVGDGGDDVLDGQEGDDKIYDDLGDDTIDGGEGDDRCWDVIGSNKVTNCEGHL